MFTLQDLTFDMRNRTKRFPVLKNKGIYFIKNTRNNKLYIGSTSRSFSARWASHISELSSDKHPNTKLLNAWKKYKDYFVFGILEIIEDNLNIIPREQYWLDYLKPYYNILKDATTRLGIKHSKQTKQKLSYYNNLPHVKEYRASIMSKEWEFYSPTGELVKFSNLQKFCKKNNLNQGLMWGVHAERRGHHKGWRIKPELNYKDYTIYDSTFFYLQSLEGFSIKMTGKEIKEYIKGKQIRFNRLIDIAEGRRNYHKGYVMKFA